MLLFLPAAAGWAPESIPDTPANRLCESYFAAETDRVARSGGLADVRDADDWVSRAATYRRELADMLGLDPFPERTPLEPVKTGELTGAGFVVEKLHYQSLPGLHVTASLYRPATIAGRLPAILYVCGHGPFVRDGVSIGNKASYSRHGVWFARHGYVCLIVDTVEMGEIRGEHHGTYSKGRWWWWSRGYTPAGVEAWNGIRGLDYLVSRPDVDPARLGVTGRSGGGATSWWVAALDERVRAAAPTAGITDLADHVVGDCVEGHCDCMYFNNTRRWDFSRVAALVAPRPLLICNTDKDPIFPLDGVYRLYRDVRRIYRLLGADSNLGLQVAEGPHKDLQPLNSGAFHWFERHLKAADPMQVIDEGPHDLPEPHLLKVFDQLPSDERNTSIDETFVPRPPVPPPPRSLAEWEATTAAWKQSLLAKTFAGWPEATPPEPRAAGSETRDGVQMGAYDFQSQDPYSLRLFLVSRAGLAPAAADRVVLSLLDEQGWREFCAATAGRFGAIVGTDCAGEEAAFERLRRQCTESPSIFAFVCPRGIGPTAWSGSAAAETHRRRRFHLLGQTVDGMRIWDIRQAVRAVAKIPDLSGRQLRIRQLRIQGRGDLAVDAIYAAIFEPSITGLDLADVPVSHDRADGDRMSGPALLDVLRTLDIPQALALAATHCRVRIATASPSEWTWPVEALGNLGRGEQLVLGGTEADGQSR